MTETAYRIPPTEPAISPAEECDDVDFRKSFLKTRIVVGVVGVLLPVVVVFGDLLIFKETGQPTLSDYYYSAMRNWFVGSLWAIGSGLLIYLAARRNRGDSVISFLAGMLAIGVSLFPTSHPPLVGDSIVSTLHLVCAGSLFTLLGVMSIRFGRRDSRRGDRGTSWSRRWSRVHYACGAIIFAAIIGSIAVSTFVQNSGNIVLIGESIAVMAFGASWFLKGSELFNILREAKGKPAKLRPTEQD